MGVVAILALSFWLSSTPGAAAAQDALVLTRASDPLYHWPGCPVVRDAKDVLAMTQGQAAGRGKKPHADCDPANVRQTPGERKRAEALKTPLYIASSDRYYHREKCEKLGTPSRKVSLDEAAKKRFPCRTCKPPIRPRPPR
jgi:hypothetical protein